MASMAKLNLARSYMENEAYNDRENEELYLIAVELIDKELERRKAERKVKR